MDAAAEHGRNPVSKHQIQPEYGDEQADAGRRKIFRVFPSNGTGKRSRLCTVGWERDGKAGRQKVDGMGWELTISRWDGNGREIKQSGNKSRNRSGNKLGNKLGNKSGNTSGNKSGNKLGNKSGNTSENTSA